MKRTSQTILALFFVVSASFSTIIGVPSQYATIQSAINSSVNGDTILVEPGTYFENINFRGKEIVLTSRFYITQDPATINSTIINGSTPTHPDTGSCVIISGGEDSSTVLQGFAITGGSGTKWTDEHGAGLYREGGGILVQYSSPIIQFNIVYNNIVTNITGVTSTGGGGIRIGDSYVRFYNNIVMNNTARYGGGVVLNYTGGDLKNNIICANYGSNQYGAGTGIWINGNFPRQITVVNNTITGNSSVNGTCGVYGFGTAAFRNNIIWGNTSPTNIQVTASLNMTYSNIQGGHSGAGNININPLFADSNYILQTGSPCIDAGDSSAVYNDPADPNNPTLAGYPSMGSLRNDMGAYGGPLRRILTNQLIGISGNSSFVPKGFILEQNYPNPFNPNTMISFSIPASGNIKLSVFDITGREVAEVFSGFKTAGSYEVNFNSAGLSSGVYFYRLLSGSIYITRKMLLVK